MGNVKPGICRSVAMIPARLTATLGTVPQKRRKKTIAIATNRRYPRLLGMCKPPVAAGRGTGNRPFDVVPGHPDRSILPYRMASTDPGVMMPELGRDLEHKEAVDLIIRYITTLKGACEEVDGPTSATAR